MSLWKRSQADEARKELDRLRQELDRQEDLDHLRKEELEHLRNELNRQEELEQLKQELNKHGDLDERRKEELDRLRKEELDSRIQQTRKRLRQARHLKQICLFMVTLCAAVTPLVFVLWSSAIRPGLTLLAYALLFLAATLYFRVHELDRRLDIQDAEGEKDLLTIADDSIQQRAEKLFRVHQLELKKYYDQTLKHSSRIFAVGIVCLLLGFVIIGGTIYLVILPSSQQLQGLPEKVTLAVLGAIGGVLSNFIAAIYLKMHSETIKSLTEFHNRLVLTHHLHFGNFLAAKIANENLRESTLANIASSLVQARQELGQVEQLSNGQVQGAAE